jgi:hypothetical protein
MEGMLAYSTMAMGRYGWWCAREGLSQNSVWASNMTENNYTIGSGSIPDHWYAICVDTKFLPVHCSIH